MKTINLIEGIARKAHEVVSEARLIMSGLLDYEYLVSTYTYAEAFANLQKFLMKNDYNGYEIVLYSGNDKLSTLYKTEVPHDRHIIIRFNLNDDYQYITISELEKGISHKEKLLHSF